MQKVIGVDILSIAEELGVAAGDTLLAINGNPVLDIVDYEYFCADEHLVLSFLRESGEAYDVEFTKDPYEGLGMCFETGLMSTVHTCENHCLFCFIDQMPKGGRDTLQFKDDDWRLSFIMGNYISLTNISDAEFERIIARRVSPLFISVHAIEPQVRVKMMRNKQAGLLYERLLRLKAAGLQFHCQIVCCPGINDKNVLDKTLTDLYALYPEAVSVAVVPVGLTKYRQGLYPLRPFTKEEAQETVQQVERFALSCKKTSGDAFAYVSDEFVLSAGLTLPPYEWYGSFPQIENGVGLLRLFEAEFLDALEEKIPLAHPICFDAAGGILAHPFFQELLRALEAYHICYTLHEVQNVFFGPHITVGGLLTGQDLLAQLTGKLKSDILLLPHNMLREREDVFLDGMTIDELAQALGVQVMPVRGDGEAWVQAIFALPPTP